MIRDSALQSIKSKNYDLLLEELTKHESLPDSFKMMVEEMVLDHKFIIRVRDRIIEITQKTNQGLFGDLFDKQKSVADPSETPNTDDSNDSSQTHSDKNQDTNTEPDQEQKKKRGKKEPLHTAQLVEHTLTDEQKNCDSCGNKMHMQRTKTTSVVLAMPLFKTETHTADSCRCLTCDTQKTAEIPKYATESETIGRYHVSAVATLAAYRYQYGIASYRLQKLSQNSGQRISDSTQWSLFAKAAVRLNSFFAFLQNTAANAPISQFDDTHNLVISTVKEIEHKQEMALKEGQRLDNIRTGIHTTNITAVYPEGQVIIYHTGLHHAGESIQKLFSKRSVEAQVTLMSDASTANTSKIKGTDLNFEMAYCNSHAFRKFKEILKKEQEIAKQAGLMGYQGSELISFLLQKYRGIFENEKIAQKLSPQQRLDYHQKHSLLLLNQMKDRMEAELQAKRIEPNSDVGRSCAYFIKHFIQLSAFSRIKSAPICNNLCERMLKSIIRQRKNSLFYKNSIGAAVADMLTSILFTADANGLNTTEYLTHLLLFKEHWEKDSEAWLPWNYKDTITKIYSEYPEKPDAWNVPSHQNMIPNLSDSS